MTPLRYDAAMDVAETAALLRETEEHHAAYEAGAPAHQWSAWYAAYMVARQNGRTADEAAGRRGPLHRSRAALTRRRPAAPAVSASPMSGRLTWDGADRPFAT